jgi:hypothetical protein
MNIDIKSLKQTYSNVNGKELTGMILSDDHVKPSLLPNTTTLKVEEKIIPVCFPYRATHVTSTLPL